MSKYEFTWDRIDVPPEAKYVAGAGVGQTHHHHAEKKVVREGGHHQSCQPASYGHSQTESLKGNN